MGNNPVNRWDPTGLYGTDSSGYSWSNPTDPKWKGTGPFKEDYSKVPTATVKYHLGEDSQQFSGEKNTTKGAPVLSRTAGKVVDTGFTKATGKFVRVEGEDGGRTDYFHLDSVEVEKDQEVGPGKTLGTAGNTGPDGTKPHLHVAQSYPGDQEQSGNTLAYGNRTYVPPPDMSLVAEANNPKPKEGPGTQGASGGGGGLLDMILSWFGGDQ